MAGKITKDMIEAKANKNKASDGTCKLSDDENWGDMCLTEGDVKSLINEAMDFKSNYAKPIIFEARRQGIINDDEVKTAGYSPKAPALQNKQTSNLNLKQTSKTSYIVNTVALQNLTEQAMNGNIKNTPWNGAKFSDYNNDIKEYKQYALGVDPTANPNSSQSYSFEAGKDGNIHRQAVIQIMNKSAGGKSANTKNNEIHEAAGTLLRMIDSQTQTNQSLEVNSMNEQEQKEFNDLKQMVADIAQSTKGIIEKQQKEAELKQKAEAELQEKAKIKQYLDSDEGKEAFKQYLISDEGREATKKNLDEIVQSMREDKRPDSGAIKLDQKLSDEEIKNLKQTNGIIDPNKPSDGKPVRQARFGELKTGRVYSPAEIAQMI